MPSSGSNRVEVDRTRYRYIVSKSSAVPGGTVSLAVTVQLRNQNGAYLRVLGLTAVSVTEVLPKSRKARLKNQVIKPHHVARLIKLGLACGWKSASPGPPVLLQVNNSDVFSEGRTE